MSMESLGGNLPAPGQAVSVSSGNRVDVFAIAAGGAMMHWTCIGDAWSGPEALPPAASGGVPMSFPCAIALADGSLHVFAIGNGGGLVHWHGPSFGTPREYGAGSGLPAGGNGLAVAASGNGRFDVFGVIAGGPIVDWTFQDGNLVGTIPVPATHVPTSVLAAVSSEPGRIDLFAIGGNDVGDRPLQWKWQGGTWSGPMVLAGPQLGAGNNGLCAVSPSPGNIDLFGICSNVAGTVAHWQGDFPLGFAENLPRAVPPWFNVFPGVPAAVYVDTQHLEVFVNGPGSHVLRWQRFGGAWGPVWCSAWNDGNPFPVAIDGNLAGNGVGVSAVARGGRLDVFAIGGDATLQHWPGGGGQGGEPWHDWVNLRSVTPQAHCHPSTLEELVAIVKRAEQGQQQVRACGSHWSYAGIATTTDVLVETDRLASVLDSVIGSHRAVLNAAAAGRHFVHVEAGIKFRDLLRYLDLQQLAPITMGGSDGQSLAGLLSTSVHGCDFDRGPVVDTVRALHLVGPGGVQHWIEPAQGITDANALRAALGPDVQLHYDDDYFDSALVAVGSLGIIYAAIVEVVPQYDLVQQIDKVAWSDARTWLETGLEAVQVPGPPPRTEYHALFEENRGLQIAIEPTGDPRATRSCYLTKRIQSNPTAPAGGGADPIAIAVAMFKQGVIQPLLALAPAAALSIVPVIAATPGGALAVTALDVALAPFGGLATLVAAGAITGAALEILVTALQNAGDGAIGDFVALVLQSQPQISTWLTTVLTSFLQQTGESRGWAHTMMAGDSSAVYTLARGPGFEAALDCNDGSHLRYVDEVLEILVDEYSRGNVLGGWLSMRFVGHSRAHLSPQRSSRTCMVEAVGLRGLNSTMTILNRMEEACRRHNGIPHWGMNYNVLPSDVTRAFPNLDTWRRVRAELGGTSHTFDNAYANDVGLTAAASPHATTPTMTSLAACLDAGVGGDLFGLGSDGQVWQRTRTSPRRGFPPGWNYPFATIGGAGGMTKLAMARNADGRVEAYALDGHGALFHAWQQGSRRGAFTGWSRIYGPTLRDLAVARNADGRLEVFGPSRHDFGDIPFQHVVQQGPNGGWGGLLALGDKRGLRRAVVGANQDGRLEVFALDEVGGAWHCWQTALGGSWGPWVSLAGSDLRDLAVANHADGRVVLFAIGGDHRLYQIAQTSPNGGWGGWSLVGSTDARFFQIAVARRGDGRLELFALEGRRDPLDNGNVWRLTQAVKDGDWGSWARWSSLRAKHVAIASEPDGRLAVFAVDNKWAIQQAEQAAISGDFAAWAVIP
jgi:FAD binding domain/D-arabinono-1,4-lactone oxidase